MDKQAPRTRRARGSEARETTASGEVREATATVEVVKETTIEIFEVKVEGEGRTLRPRRVVSDCSVVEELPCPPRPPEVEALGELLIAQQRLADATIIDALETVRQAYRCQFRYGSSLRDQALRQNEELTKGINAQLEAIRAMVASTSGER